METKRSLYSFYSKIPDKVDFYSYKYMPSICDFYERGMEHFRQIETNNNVHYISSILTSQLECSPRFGIKRKKKIIITARSSSYFRYLEPSFFAPSLTALLY